MEPWYEGGERTLPPLATVERLRPHFGSLGITRLARQTDLDRLGIPCFSAVRPAGLTLSVTQGKGLDDAAAMASAVMEAAELSVAEASPGPYLQASLEQLAEQGRATFSPRRLLPPSGDLPIGLPIRWVEGQRWPSGAPTWLPLDALTLGGLPADLPQISRSTNGLASGNNAPEALFHAVCELVERDATSLWSLLSDEEKLSTEIGTADLDPVNAVLRERIVAAGCTLRLFDQTTDLGVPCLMAVISEPSAGRGRYFDTSAGYGCHPVGSRAIARAITEAAQTRVTNIAGARDDFLPLEYVAAPDSSAAFLSGPNKAAMVAPIWLREGTPLPAMLERLETAVGAVADISWARLGGEQFGIAVVRALSGTLEDREANIHWRPGRRALRVLTRQ